MPDERDAVFILVVSGKTALEKVEDQLGTAVELSLESGLPLVYIHSGLELSGALAPADPTATAERLLT